MSSAHATKQEIDEFFKHTKASAANKVRVEQEAPWGLAGQRRALAGRAGWLDGWL